MPTLDEITLTVEQEKEYLIPLCKDVAEAPNELKLLVRLQKHVKKIWEAGAEDPQEKLYTACVLLNYFVDQEDFGEETITKITKLAKKFLEDIPYDQKLEVRAAEILQEI